MKRFVHYAGEPIVPIQLPHGCRWVRVTDFETLGVYNLGTAGANGQDVTYEEATVFLDLKNDVPVRDYAHFSRSSQLPDWKILILKGNIEVEAGEAGDLDPGPVRLIRIDSPYRIDLSNGVYANVPLPKGTRHFSIYWEAGATDINSITRLRIFPAYFDIRNSSYGFVSNSPWRTGQPPTVNPYNEPTRFNYTLPPIPFFDVQGLAAQSVILNMGIGNPAIDNIDGNPLYSRPWSPVPMIRILVDCDAEGAFCYIHIHD